MSNPLVKSLCHNKTNRATKPNYVLYSKYILIEKWEVYLSTSCGNRE